MTVAIFSCALGMLLTWIGWRHWRYRKEDTISVLEAGILKVAGQEPLRRARVDRVLTHVQAILGLLLGPFFLLIGIAGVLVELEVI